MNLRTQLDEKEASECTRTRPAISDVAKVGVQNLRASRRGVNTNPAMRQALEYARRGWPVLPIVRGKKDPPMVNSYSDATTDELTIKRWWGDHPDANLAILTGRKSGILAVCPDLYKADCQWPELEREHGTINTYRDASPSGGEHLLFKMPARVKIITHSDTSSPIPGVDIKANGAYLIMSPSTFEGRCYKNISDAPLARVPKWLREILLKTPNAKRDTRTSLLSVSLRMSQPAITTCVNTTMQAVLFATPKRVGESNDCLFLLARGLLNVQRELGRDLTDRECQEAFDLWYDRAHELLRESYSYYQKKFWRDREEARYALSATSIRAAWFAACEQPLPPEAALVEAPDAKRLVALCWQLEQATDGNWFLSARTAGELIGKSAVMANAHLKRLVEGGVLRITHKYPRWQRKATEFQFITQNPKEGTVK